MTTDTVSTMLASWHDTTARRAIVDFVEKVTREGGADYVPPAERIAVFDNDGTLWCEKPMQVEVGFILKRLAEMAETDPELRERQPWKAAYSRDYGWFGDVITKHYHGDEADVKVLMGGILRAFAGMSVEDYADAADAFMDGQHPTLGRALRGCGYLPMIELLRYLEANGFTTYIASGGDRDFMRPFADTLYGIPPERVIGSALGLDFDASGDGTQLMYKSEIEFFDDGPQKPVRIWSRVGRRPLVAGGNSNGDIPMLRFTRTGPQGALRLLVLHDDAEREFAYTAGAEDALERAKADGWTVVSVKDDWGTVFADQ